MYAVVPIALAVLVSAELRTPGREPDPAARMPEQLRWVGTAALALLQAGGLACYPDAVDWASTAAWLYVALFAGVGLPASGDGAGPSKQGRG